MTIRIKNVRDAPAKADGYRVLVDRLWPRGIRKEDLAHDLWFKDVAPSTELRKWFHAAPDARFEEFARRYRTELDGSDALERLREIATERGTVTLLVAAKDRDHNQAVILEELLA